MKAKPMNVPKTLKGLLKTKKKTLSVFQTEHLKAVIKLLSLMPTDFNKAKVEYTNRLKEIRDER